MAFGDGSVRFVTNGLTMNQMQALLSRAGGETIPTSIIEDEVAA